MQNLTTACHICNAGKRDIEGTEEALWERRIAELQAFREYWSAHWGDDVDDFDRISWAESSPDFQERYRKPLTFDFDVYTAAEEQSKADWEPMCPEAIEMIAEAF